MMQPDAIKQALGYGAQTQIAKRTKRSVAHVFYCIGEMDDAGNITRRRDAKVEREIAKRLKLTVEEVFGASVPSARASK